MAANTTTGTVRTVVSNTFSEWRGDRFARVDDETFLWTSERDGWNDLYLYDFQGNLFRRLTQRAFPVDRVIAVDVDEDWVYFCPCAWYIGREVNAISPAIAWRKFRWTTTHGYNCKFLSRY